MTAQQATPAYWKIDRDVFNVEDGDVSRVGVSGPRHGDEALPLTVQFKLKDDDGNTYYYGHCADNELSIDLALEYGTTDVGATEIWTRKGNGPWSSYY